ncbi:MAG TPA: Kdo hydroxylase family protein, partial [Rhizomicrobium sp.]
MSDVVEEIDIESWSGPFEPATRAAAQAALERGKVLLFPHLAFAMTDAEKTFLDARIADGKAKNISLDPESGKIQGTSLAGEDALRLAAMIERFGADATKFVHGLLPNYAGVERARTSYRPVEVKGRAYSVI